MVDRRSLLGGLAALVSGGVLPARLMAQTVVAGPEALADALNAAGPGTVLSLAPGEYGSLNLRRFKGAPGAPVTLVASDLARRPRFQRMDLREVAHLVLVGLQFDYSFASEDKIHFRPFTVVDGQDIVIRDCLFDGDKAKGVSTVDDGYGWAFGLGVTDVSGFTLERCELRDFFRGLVVARCNDVTVRGNDLHDLRMDGMNFAQVRLVTIADNHIHDFNRSVNSKDHADMIQFWTNGTDAPSSMITIRGNLLASGRGAWTQSIFMRNEEVDTGRAGPEMLYRDILIEENVIANAHLHGITVGETDGLTIRRNTVLRNPLSQGEKDNPTLWTPQIRVAEGSANVTVERNVVFKVTGFEGQADWQVADNMPVQDRTRIEAGFFDKLFAGDPAKPGTLHYRKGGPLDGAGIGAPQLQLD
jgi:Right handed beta helix region